MRLQQAVLVLACVLLLFVSFSADAVKIGNSDMIQGSQTKSTKTTQPDGKVSSVNAAQKKQKEAEEGSDDPFSLDLYYDIPTEQDKLKLAERWELKAMMAPEDATLWTLHYEKMTRKPFYYNSITGYSSWKKKSLTKLARSFDVQVDSPPVFRAPPPPSEEMPHQRDFCSPYLCMNSQACVMKKCDCDSDWEGELCQIPSQSRRNRILQETLFSPEFALQKQKQSDLVSQKEEDLRRRRDLFSRILPTLNGKDLLPVSDAKGNSFPSALGADPNNFPGPRDNLHQMVKDNAWAAEVAMMDNGISNKQFNKFELYPVKGGTKDKEGKPYANEFVPYPVQFKQAKKVSKQVRKLLDESMGQVAQLDADLGGKLANLPVEKKKAKALQGDVLELGPRQAPLIRAVMRKDGAALADFDKAPPAN